MRPVKNERKNISPAMELFLRHFYPLALFEDCSTRDPIKNAIAYRANRDRKEFLLDAIASWFIIFSYSLFAMRSIEECHCYWGWIPTVVPIALIGISISIIAVFLAVYSAAYLYLRFVDG